MKEFLKNIVYIGIGTGVAYLLGRFVAPIFTPFIIAVVLAFFIDPLVDSLQKRTRMPRAAAVGLAMLVVVGGTGLILTLVVTRLIVELVHFSASLPQYITNIKSVIFDFSERGQAYYLGLPKEVVEFINQKVASTDYGLDSIFAQAEIITSKLLRVMIEFVSSVPMWIIIIIVSAIATYFMAKDKRIIIGFWLQVIPEPWGKKIINIAKDVFAAVVSYARAQMVLITLTFIQSLVGLYIIGAPYALSMGLLIGFADIIPILGPSSIYLPWIFWEVITGDTGFALKLTVLYAIVLTVRQVLETKIVSTTMGLHPLATITGMYVGLQLLGPLGLLAGPLFIITLKAVFAAGLIHLNRS